MKPTIRTLSLQELTALVDWAAAEGWNPGLEDASMFQTADPEGFIGAFVGTEMVAAISAVAYGGSSVSSATPIMQDNSSSTDSSSASTSAGRTCAARATAKRCGTPV